MTSRRVYITILIILNALLATILLFTAYGGMIPPSVSTLPAVAAMTFPAVLAVTVIVLVINLFTKPRLAIINGLSLLLCIGPLHSYCPVNISSFHSTVQGDTSAFTLMSYNVMNLTDYSVESSHPDDHDLANNGETMRYILRHQADIVALQECAEANWASIERKFPALADSVKDAYPYILCNVAEGVSLFSRYPFKAVDMHFPVMKSFAAQCYDIDIQGHHTTLINVHLQSIGLSVSDKQLYMELTKGDARTKKELKEVRTDIISKLSEAFRQREIQARIIRQALDSITGPAIVCGDFNDIPDSYALRHICDHQMKSAFTEAGNGPGISYHANRFYFRIDHCLYRGDLRAVSCKILKNPTSDHYPLMTTFQWTATAQ